MTGSNPYHRLQVFICGCVLQVEAGNLTPVTALVQNLLMSALFEPFEALCSAANAEMAEVWNMIDPLASLLRCGPYLGMVSHVTSSDEWAFDSGSLSERSLRQPLCQLAVLWPRCSPCRGLQMSLTVLQALKYFNTSKQHPSVAGPWKRATAVPSSQLGWSLSYGECTISEARPSAHLAVSPLALHLRPCAPWMHFCVCIELVFI